MISFLATLRDIGGDDYHYLCSCCCNVMVLECIGTKENFHAKMFNSRVLSDEFVKFVSFVCFCGNRQVLLDAARLVIIISFRLVE